MPCRASRARPSPSTSSELQIDRELDDRRGQGFALRNLAAAYRQLGEAQQALSLYQAQLQLAGEIGDRLGASIANWNMGVLYEEQGDLAQAIAAMQRCVDYEREIDHPDAAPDAARVAALRQKLAAAG